MFKKIIKLTKQTFNWKYLCGLLLSGILVLFLIGVEKNSVHTLNKQQYSINKIIKQNRNQIISNQQKNITHSNYKNVSKNAKVSEYIAARNHYSKTIQKSMIGQLTIPSVHINLPVFSGMSNAALLNGVGTFSKKRSMGQGNFVMMAHNLPAQYSDALLQPLSQIKPKAKIRITDFNNVYTYEASYKNIVDSSNIKLLGQTHKSIVTLFRCVGEHGTNNRLIVQGNLISSHPYQQKNQNNFPSQTSSIAIPKRSNFDNFNLKMFQWLDLTGDFQKDILQFIIACLPAIITIVVLGKKIIWNLKKESAQ